jgi:hypothetical protein
MPRRDFRRKPGQQQPRQSLLIVCQGEQTEYNYVRALKRDYNLSNVTVAIDSTRRDPKAAVDLAVRKWTKESFDEVWCVFDHEFPPDNALFYPAVVCVLSSV